MFAFRLAAFLKMTVRTLLNTIDSAELTEWMAFERLEPFGALADDFRFGTVAAAVYNSQRTSKKDPFFKPDELMPGLGAAVRRSKSKQPKTKDKLTPDQHAALFDAVIFGVGKVKH